MLNDFGNDCQRLAKVPQILLCLREDCFGGGCDPTFVDWILSCFAAMQHWTLDSGPRLCESHLTTLTIQHLFHFFWVLAIVVICS